MTAPRHQPKPCRFCTRPVFWAQSETTRTSFPVDAEPSATGTVQLVDRRGSVIALVLGDEMAANVRDAAWALKGKHTLRTPHRETCPNVDEWRTKKTEARDG